jgi:DNA-binding beta-propeller fold protein YncE
MKRFAVSSALVLALALAFTGGAAHAAPQAGPTLIRTVPLPALKPGDFDQFAVDQKRNRLYVSAEANNAIEVFNLHTGALIRAGGPVKAPHKLAVDEATGRLFVADGGGNAVKVLGRKLNLIKTIPTGLDPDGGGYDSAHGIFYVGSQVNNPAADTSTIDAISMATMTVTASVPLASHTLKAMVIDPATDRLFVSMRDRNEIGVIDLKTHTVEGMWSPSQMNMPVPLALDQADNLLFVGARRPGQLFALNATDGHVVQVLPSTDISDSMSYDDRTRMLYVTGASGLSVYRVIAGGDIKPVGLFDTGAGKSSLLVPDLNRLYVARPKTAQHDAALEIYQLSPPSN